MAIIGDGRLKFFRAKYTNHRASTLLDNLCIGTPVISLGKCNCKCGLESSRTNEITDHYNEIIYLKTNLLV